MSDTFAVEVFKRSYAELRLIDSQTQGDICMDLGSHISGDTQFSSVTATNAIALSKSVLDASEMKVVGPYLNE